MSNVNTCADVILGQNNGQPITLASTTTLHKAFSLGGTAALLTLPNPLALVDALQQFPSRNASAIPFIVRAAGLVTGGERYQIDINQGSGLTPTVVSTGLAISGITADNWFLEAQMLWDPTSLLLRGFYYGWMGNQAVDQVALVSSVSPANLAALTFNCAVTIYNANVNALFTLTDFSADLS